MGSPLKKPFLYKLLAVSEQAVAVSFEQIMDVPLNEYIIYIGQKIEALPFVGFVEAVPAIASLTVFYDVLAVRAFTKMQPSVFVQNYLAELLNSEPFGEQPKTQKKIIEIPVHYNGADLEEVLAHCQLSKSELVRLHTAPTYRIFMMGFLPGFAYMGGMDKRLIIPRKNKPRTTVPAGSVGIGGEQTGVYPLDSPGGWQLIGTTEMQLFLPNKEDVTLLQQGDYVRFVGI